MIEFGHATHRGLVRAHNEDTYSADGTSGIFLVADGMGGPGRGEVASTTARDALVEALRAGHDLEPSIRAAARDIAHATASTQAIAPTGTTLALLQLDGAHFAAAQVGDARVLAWKDGRVRALFADSEPATSSTAADGDAVDPAPQKPRRNRITQALGLTPADDLCAEPVRGALERGMQFLLCSDGLGDELDDRRIAALLSRTDISAQECVEQLLLAALDAGGRDNVTAVLVRVG